MIKLLRLYGRFLQPWLTVVVYLWLLQLIADFSIDDTEPLLDRLADCSAILWTLIFWMASAVLILWSITLVFNYPGWLYLNDRAAQGVLIIVTAIAFVRWLFILVARLGNPDAVLYVLIVVCLLMGAWVWCRQKRLPERESSLPSSRDAWYFLALPILIVSALLLAVTLRKQLAILKYNHSAPSRSVTPVVLNQAPQSRPNVVLIVSDALRAKNMSLYGYGRKTSPFLDRFAEQSTVYTRMYTNNTSTRTSLTSILSGKHPLSHGRLTKFMPVYDSPQNLVAMLKDIGYTTAAITSNSDASFYSLGLNKYLVYGEYPNFYRLTLSWLRDNGVYPTSTGYRMYDELAQFLPFLGYPDKTLFYGPARDTLDRARRVLTILPQPFFLFVHVHEPHDPYDTPPPFRGKYAKVNYREAYEKISSGYYARYQPQLQPFVDVLRDYYDEAIEYLDDQLSKFVGFLDQNLKSQNVLLIITGDHGESFERGFLNHGEDLYESSIHVPLIIRFPHQRSAERMSMPAQSIDIAPTLVQSLGVSIPTWMEGTPLTTKRNLEERDMIVVNFKDPIDRKIYRRPTKIAILWKQYKMIVSCDTERVELYNLGQDPGEETNLSVTEASVVNALQGKLKQHLAKQRSDSDWSCSINSGT